MLHMVLQQLGYNQMQPHKHHQSMKKFILSLGTRLRHHATEPCEDTPNIPANDPPAFSSADSLNSFSVTDAETST